MHSKTNDYLAFLMGLGSGAALMYLLDPNTGARRRSIARDKLVHGEHAARTTVEKGARDLRHRGQGLFARLRSWFSHHDDAGDEVIVARVRSELGRLVSHPRAIEVTSLDGLVFLEGDVLERELDGLIAGACKVRGVREVESRLRMHDRADGVPALQGGTARRLKGALMLNEDWSPGLRVLGSAAGMYLGARGLHRGGVIGTMTAALGGALTLRAMSNLTAGSLFGVGAGYRAVNFHKTITVQAPVEEVYRFWTHIENFPHFMQHVREVKRIDDIRSHWKVVGPAGVAIEWDAEITKREPNRVFAWRTLDGCTVEHSGAIHFQPTGDNATRLDIHMSYAPPAGAIGHSIASLFHVDPKAAMDDDLVRMKSLLEDGKSRAHGRSVTYEELVNQEAASAAASQSPPSVIPEWPTYGDLER